MRRRASRDRVGGGSLVGRGAKRGVRSAAGSVLFVLLLVGALPLQFAEAEETSGWSTPLRLSTGPALDPEVVIDANGNALVVWREGDPRTLEWGGVVHGSWFFIDEGWEEPEELLWGTVWRPLVAFGSQGQALVVGGSYSGLATNRYEPGYDRNSGSGLASEGGWTGYDKWAYGYTTSRPQMDVDEAGRATIVWAKDGPAVASSWWDSKSVYATRFLVPETPPHREVALTPAEGCDRQPDVAVDSRGSAIAVWVREASCYNEVVGRIYAAHFEEDRGWGSKIELSTHQRASEPRVAMSPEGHAIAVWGGVHGGVAEEVAASRYVRGVGWTEPEMLGRGWSPVIDMDSAGNAAVMWEGGDIYVSRYVADGGGWTRRVNLGRGEQAAVALDPSGDVMAVWTVRSGDYPGVYMSRFSVGSGWTAPLGLWAGLPVGEPRVAIDAKGNAAVVWAGELAPGTPHVWTTRFVADTVPPPLILTSPTPGLATDVPTVTVSGLAEPDATVLVNGLQVLVRSDGCAPG